MSDAALHPDVVLIEKLSPSDLIRRAIQIAPAAIDPPHKKASCATDVWFTAFFDGTGNSLHDEDGRAPDQQAYSNVARLYMAHAESDASQGIAREYLQGVGTKFPEIGDACGVKGAATGYMGIERIDWAERRLTFAINTQRSQGLKVNTVHVAIFGFSRGASLARAFVNRLAKQAEQQGGRWVRDGARFRIYFVGIFDTVASVGLPRDHGTYAKELGIPSIVERCVHMVAGHELRFAFPLDSVRRDGNYPMNTVEYVYPGVHSDVGGGYAVNEQGRSNVYARLPLHKMYCEARLAGVPLSPLEDLAPKFQREFAIPTIMPAAFRTYMNVLETTGSSLEEQMFGHLKLYWRWRKLRMNDAQSPIRQRLTALSQQVTNENAPLISRLMTLQADEHLHPDRPRSNTVEEAKLTDAINDRLAENRKLAAQGKQLTEADKTLLAEARALGRTVASGRASTWEKAIWEAWNDPRPLPAEVAAFLDHYVHDSQAAWDHATDAGVVALNRLGASETCGQYFTQAAAQYCAAVDEENRAGTVEYLRPRTLFFGAKSAVFASTDTGY